MADENDTSDKTEDPTQKRLDDALERGDVVKSQELNTWFVIAGDMMQHRLVWSGEQLKPKFSKISPAAGAKRIFGKQALANFAKGIFKLAALGAVMTAILWPERHRLEAMVRFDPAALLGVTST